MADITLGSMIEELRNELQGAMEQGKGRTVRFELGEITLEAEFEVRQSVEAKAGFKLLVFTSAEAKGAAGRTRTHKVTLKLTPYDSTLGEDDLITSPKKRATPSRKKIQLKR